MELYKLISFMIYNILSVYVGVRIIELFLIRNYRRQKMAIFLYSGTWLINSIVSILDCGIIFTRISIVLCFIILAFFLYEGDWKIKVVAVTSSIVMGIIVENIVWMFSNTINKPIVLRYKMEKYDSKSVQELIKKVKIKDEYRNAIG